jgi:hypothetical protein
LSGSVPGVTGRFGSVPSPVCSGSWMG